MEGAFYIVAALLLVSGGSKLSDPGSTRGALRAAGLPSTRFVVYLLAVVEIGTGGWSIAFGGDPAGWGLSALYLGFFGFVLFARVRHLPLSSCGCFGKADTPPTLIHLTVNLLAAGVGIWAALAPARPLIEVMRGQVLVGVPYLLFVGAGTYLLYLLLSELPKLTRRRAFTESR